MCTILKYVKLTEFAFPPIRTTNQSAGLDLKSSYEYKILPNERVLVKTDLSVRMPEGTYGKIEGRSGLALNYGIIPIGGIIDFDFQGNIGIILINHGEETFIIQRGDRVAQLICYRIELPLPLEVKELVKTERGNSGFGSTGMK